MTSARKKPTNTMLKPGSKVIIVQNPHDPRAEGIVGTVIAFRAAAGFGNSDLVDVRYREPRDGGGLTRPFGLSCLRAATPAELNRLASQHEEAAKALRSLARSMSARD